MTAYMMYKPRGCVTSMRRNESAAVADYLPEGLVHVHPVGRLDKDTEGLLLFTDDGYFDSFCLRPDNHFCKTYQFACFGSMTDDQAAKLSQGVILCGSGYHTAPAKCTVLAHSTIGACSELLPAEKKEHYLKNPGRPVTIGEIEITEGKKHQVRLMVKAAGCHVFWLRRIKFGPLQLDLTMNPGDVRKLTRQEIDSLGYSPDAVKSMRRFGIYELIKPSEALRLPPSAKYEEVNGYWVIRLGTFFYGDKLTYLPAEVPEGFQSLLGDCFQKPFLSVDAIYEIQYRIREGDRNRALYDREILLPGDRCLIRREGRVKRIEPDTLSAYQCSFL